MTELIKFQSIPRRKKEMPHKPFQVGKGSSADSQKRKSQRDKAKLNKAEKKTLERVQKIRNKTQTKGKIP